MTITDNYYCPGGVCPGGGFTIQTAAHGTSALSSVYIDSDGTATTFTGAPGMISSPFQSTSRYHLSVNGRWCDITRFGSGETITITDSYYNPVKSFDIVTPSLAAVPATETPAVGCKAARAAPGHLLMCGHAVLLGAIEATG